METEFKKELRWTKIQCTDFVKIVDNDANGLVSYSELVKLMTDDEHEARELI